MKLRIDLEPRCNNNCIFCSIHGENIKRSDMDEMIKIIKKGGIESVNFLGGEPTLDKSLIPLIKECKNQKIPQINITSNGRLLSYPEFCKKLIEAGLDGISISLYGPNKETHEACTRAPGSFDQTIKGIKNMEEYGIITDINIVVTKINEKCIYETIEKALSINPKINQVRIVFMNPSGSAKDRSYLFSRINTLRKEISRLRKFIFKLVLLDFPYCAVEDPFYRVINNKENVQYNNTTLTIHKLL